MKKAVKAIIAASAVAAVVGVGAVSYAAWSGATNTSKEVTGNTGVISTVGAVVVEAATTDTTDSSTDVTKLKALVPADQTGTYSGVNYWTFTLSSPDSTGGASVKYTIKGSISKGSDTGATELGTTAKLYWSTSAPTSATVAAPGGTEVSSTAADITGSTVYVYIVANNTDGMKAAVSLTFAAVEA